MLFQGMNYPPLVSLAADDWIEIRLHTDFDSQAIIFGFR